MDRCVIIGVWFRVSSGVGAAFFCVSLIVRVLEALYDFICMWNVLPPVESLVHAVTVTAPSFSAAAEIIGAVACVRYIRCPCRLDILIVSTLQPAAP